MTHYLDREAKQGKAGNHRNGANPKFVITPNGELNFDIPGGRQARFEPSWWSNTSCDFLCGLRQFGHLLAVLLISWRDVQRQLIAIYYYTLA